jgi:nitroreductase
MLNDLLLKSRSYRRFDESVKISQDVLRDLIDATRYCPSAANRQPLKYRLVFEATETARVFDCLNFAAYLSDWSGPAEGERPAAYLVVLGDETISEFSEVDAGIAMQTTLLRATELGFGGCIVASVKREKLREILALDERYTIGYVIALGKPAETCLIEPLGKDGDIRYYRDSEGVHHVPKRDLDDLIVQVFSRD